MTTELQSTQIQGTGYLDIPSGNTSNRPGNPETGQTRLNTDYGMLEYYTGSIWSWLDGKRRGTSPDDAILSLYDIPEITQGNYWFDPCLATNRPSEPFQVEIDTTKHEGVPYLKLRIGAQNGVYTNSYTSSNNVTKSGADEGFLFGNIGNIRSNATSFTTGPSRREFITIPYESTVNGQALTNNQVEALADWAQEMSPYSWQQSLIVDDDEHGFMIGGVGSTYDIDTVYYNGSSSSASASIGRDHPVFTHNYESDGTIFHAGFVTFHRAGNAQRNYDVFCFGRDRIASNGAVVRRYNTARPCESTVIDNNGNYSTGSARTDEFLPRRFIIPKYVSLIIDTGGGNAWAFKTDGIDGSQLIENAFYIRG